MSDDVEIDIEPDYDPHSNLKSVVGWVLSAAALISVVPVAVQVSDRLELSVIEQLLSIVILLAVLCILFLVYTVYDLRAELHRVKEEAEKQILRVQTETYDVFYGLAFATFLDEPPEEFDDTHYITQTKSEISLINDGVVFRETFEGLNATNRESDHISIRIDGDSPIDVADTDFHMYYPTNDGGWKESDNWEAERIGKYSIRFKMYFAEPLAPDESFRIRYESAAGEWPTQAEEYIELPQHRFTRGSERMNASFEFHREPESVTVKKAINDMSTSYFRNAERIEFLLEDRDIDVIHRGDAWFAQFSDTNASALYIFRFQF